MRLIALAGSVIALAAAAYLHQPGLPRESAPHLQCTVDDHLSFTMEDVRRIDATDAGTMRITRTDGAVLYRNMLPGELCTRVARIEWELTR